MDSWASELAVGRLTVVHAAYTRLVSSTLYNECLFLAGKSQHALSSGQALTALPAKLCQDNPTVLAPI